MRWLLPISCIIALAGVLVIATSSPGEAEDEGIRIAMLEQVRAMPGYDTEPETFDRYFTECHAPAYRKATSAEGRSREKVPFDPGRYAEALYRGMIDRAFTEHRTDLVDILTRALMSILRAQG